MQMLVSLLGLVVVHSSATLAPSEITTDTSWISASSPYMVADSVTVQNSATLTIQAGTVVKFSKGAELRIGRKSAGKLVVNGKPSAPVMFVSDSGAAAGHWSAIIARIKGSSVVMQNAIIAGAGSTDKSSPDSPRFGLMIGPEISCKLERVTVQSCTRGIELDTEADVTLKECVIRGCGQEAVSVSQENAHAIDSSNLISGNGIDAIVVGEVGDTGFLKSRVWANADTAYLIRGDLLVDGPTNGLSLTLCAGVTVLLDEDSSITVGWDHQADFIASGTADKPIIFKAKKGKWDGIYLGMTGANTNFLHCRFLDGGAVTAMLIADENSKANVKNCKFENSDTWAMSLGKGAKVTLENNSFSNNKLGDIDRSATGFGWTTTRKNRLEN